MNRHASHCVVLVALFGLAACDGSPKPTQPLARPAIGEPSMSLGSGLTQIQLGRANLGKVNAHSKVDGFEVELKTQDDADVSMGSTVIAPGGNTGWHGHPGMVVVLIKSGALTFYEANDPTCTPIVHGAGTVVLETSGDVHIARNEGTVNAEFVSTQYLAAGAAGRIDAPVPGNCPF